jgi:hypothetical protein
MQYKWSIAMYRGSTPFTLKPISAAPTLAPELVSEIACKTVADPFLLRRDGKWYMFFEALNGITNRGEIAYATSANGLDWEYQGIVLRENFHLSYPCVFENDGTFYMIPETRQAGAIRLYAAMSFPQDWKLVNVLVDGDYADSTVLFHNGKWRMFSQRGLDEMRVFQSESLESGWKQHPGNPFWEANRIYCRPGGRPLFYEGSWYRFAQDGRRGYGNNLRAMRITKLTDHEFEEKEIEASPILRASLSGWNAMAMHHIDAVQISASEWLAAVDGATMGT